MRERDNYSEQLALAANQREKERDFWVEKLSGFTGKVVIPRDHEFEGGQQPDLLHYSTSLDDRLWQQLEKLSNGRDLKLAMVLTAGLGLLIYKYTGKGDICLGTPILKQESQAEFINRVLVLRQFINSDMSFRDLLLQVKETILSATEHQNFPVEVIPDLLGLHGTEDGFPLFDVAILLEPVHDKRYLETTPYNILFSFKRNLKGLELEVDYNGALYTEATIEGVAGHFSRLLLQATGRVDLHPQDMEMLSQEEREVILHEFNSSGTPIPSLGNLADLLEAQVRRTPHSLCLTGKIQSNENGSLVQLSYRAYWGKVRSLAAILVERGVMPNTIVALLFENSLDMMISIMAVLTARGAYLPMAPGDPQERIGFMLQDSGVQWVLTDLEPSTHLPRNYEIINPLTASSEGNAPKAFLDKGIVSDMAYVIYTSGTTGRPKGVVVEHANVIAYVFAFQCEFNIQPGMRMLPLFPYYFDAFVEVFFPLILQGGELIIPGKSQIGDIPLLSQLIKIHGVDILDCPPLLLNEFNRLSQPPVVDTILTGGDVLFSTYIDRMLQSERIYNTYGPTETTVCAAYYRCDPQFSGPIPIGKPVVNYNIYILDPSGNLLPLGVPGELCIAGAGVARGYLNRPDLTARCFVANPFGDHKEEVEDFMYRTGDLARWLPQGNIEFLGRIDSQVKIRGYRIELGEISARLHSHEEILDAVVLVGQDGSGDKFLCAYIVPATSVNGNKPLDATTIKAYLGKSLPVYMVPSYIKLIQKMPYNSRGKLDRQALPDPLVRDNREFLPPRNKMERDIAGIWAQVLGLGAGQISRDQNFFDLGGNSLKAIAMVSRIHKLLDVKLELLDIFDAQTVAELSNCIEKSGKLTYALVEPVEKRDYYPCSPAQKRLYVLHQMQPQSLTYNMIQVMRLKGRLDWEPIKSTFDQLLKRHESLRTSFLMYRGEPVQRVFDLEELDTEFHDLSKADSFEEQEIMGIVAGFARAFDLHKAPLFRVGLIKRGEEDHILMLDMHHIVSDGVSMGVLVADFMKLYEGVKLPLQSIQYKDYAHWQREAIPSGIKKGEQDFWLLQFNEAPPVLDLPLDFSRPVVQSFEGGRTIFEIGPDHARSLRDMALQENATLFMVILSVYYLFLSRLSGQDDMVVGTVVAGRGHRDLESVVGMFVNTLALRNRISPDQSFIQFLRQVRQNTIAAFDNQDYQFQELVEQVTAKLGLKRDTHRHPLFDTLFTLQQSQPQESSEGETDLDTITMEPFHYENKVTKFDITFQATEMEDKIICLFEYGTRLFKEDTMCRFSRYFMETLDWVVNQPSREIRELDFLPREEKKQILESFSLPSGEYPRDSDLYSLFLSNVGKHPDHTALVGATKGNDFYRPITLTYGALGNDARLVGFDLKMRGVVPGEIVALAADRSLYMIIGIMGILAAGCAYLPIDPHAPVSRIEYMLSDSATHIAIGPEESIAGFPGNMEFVHIERLLGPKSSFSSGEDLGREGGHFAYVVYTSGSTGKPKGVPVAHANISPLMHWSQDRLGFSWGTKVVQNFSPFFDGSVWEIFSALCSGAALLLPGTDQVADPDRLIDYIGRQRVDVLNLTPSHFRSLLASSSEEGALGSLRFMFLGAEKLTPALVFQGIKLVSPSCRIFNMYGPTEAAVIASMLEIRKWSGLGAHNGATIPIGRPVGNSGLLILNGFGKLSPLRVTGELCITGDGPVWGYLNNPELTAEKFTQGMYRTGDLARWLTDGVVEFMGRVDGQVKIRGFRIETGEIETALLTHHNVREALVTDKEDNEGGRFLCAYVVLAGTNGESKDDDVVTQLRQFLIGALPAYMIPTYIVLLASIPLGPSGKVNLSALPAPISGQSDVTSPDGEIEKQVLAIWQEILGDGDFGVTQNFFQLGGHSLKAAQVISRISQVLAVSIPLVELFKNPTVRGLARLIAVSQKINYSLIQAVEEREYYPQSSAQKRLFFLDRLQGVGVSYNITFVFRIGGKLDAHRFGQVFSSLIHRHESLRTGFTMVGDAPVQRIYRDVPFEMATYQLKSRATDPSREQQIEGIVAEFVRPFDISSPPLMRVGLIDPEKETSVFMLDMHHIVSDGTSMGIFIDEFIQLYSGENLPPLRIQYRDFSSWQNRLRSEGKLKEQEDYWLEMFPEHKGGDIPRLDLPGDFPRPRVFTFQGDTLSVRLDSRLTGTLRKLGEKAGATLFMNLTTALNVLLHKYTGQEDIILGCGVLGRPQEDLKGLIGLFVNTLVLRNSISSQLNYRECLEQVKNSTLQAFDNQDVQFEDLVDRLNPRRDPSRNPIFDICVVLQNFSQSASKPADMGLSIDPLGVPSRTSKFDITLFGYEVGDEIVLSLEYYTSLYSRETMARMANHLLAIIQGVTENPFRPIWAIDILDDREKEDLLKAFNKTVFPYELQETMPLLFQNKARMFPDRVGLFGFSLLAGLDIHLSLSELDFRAEGLSLYLYQGKSLRPGDLVGVLLPASVEFIIASLGVLKAGAAYVPLDPALPEERLKYMLLDGEISTVISSKKYIRTLSRLQWDCPAFHTFLCLDSLRIENEWEIEKNKLMDEQLWEFVGENAGDDIDGGGWVSSFTGQPLSPIEMAEYGENALEKLRPLVNEQTKVLEVGCATGLTMYRLAPLAGKYFGTDLSQVIIDKNKQRVKSEKSLNITLSCLPAHHMNRLEEREFDLVVMNSVVQCFHGHHYLRRVIGQAIDLLGPQGYLFIGDVMDLGSRDEMIRDLQEFKVSPENRGKHYQTKTDFSEELFLSREFFEDLRHDFPLIHSLEFSKKNYTIENELTKYRYDVIIGIDKTGPQNGVERKLPARLKHRKDLSSLTTYQKNGPATLPQSGDPAYVIYTSGTTGKPKGVVVEHGALANLCAWHIHVFKITGKDRASQYANTGFDASVWEIFPYLSAGIPLYMIGEDIKLDILEVNGFFERHHITMAFLPTRFYELFAGIDNRSLRLLLTGGDKLQSFGQRTYDLSNNYGPTENAVVATSGLVKEGDFNIPIGKPVYNNSVYILDRYSQGLQPVGVAGELCISGHSLARGYLNNPSLSDYGFVDNPFYSLEESWEGSGTEKMYKTGDLARWLPDGNIEFLGRLDQQVKIRGFRIEPGEVEKHLLVHSVIREALVMAREEADGDRVLVAYVVKETGPTASNEEGEVEAQELQDYLAGKIPSYMVPAYVVFLDEFPLNPSGKIDPARLPHPLGEADSKSYVAPRNALEERLVWLWTEILACNGTPIGIDHNFFQLGGHSLKVTALCAEIHREWQLKVPLEQVFNGPTIRALSQYMKGASQEKFQTIPAVEKREYYPLSSAQKRLFVMQQMDREYMSYNETMSFFLTGQVDKNKIQLTLDKLIQRHESLRTSFHIIHDQPVQRVHALAQVLIEEYEDVPGKGEMWAGFARPFDISEVPLFRIARVGTGDGHTAIALDIHHIISDGTSLSIMINEFMALYRGEHLKDLVIQYRDYAQWQSQLVNGLEIKKQESYWLREIDRNIPPLDLPLDYPRTLDHSSLGTTVFSEIRGELLERVNCFIDKEGVTLYIFLLSLYFLLLFKYSSREDIVVGCGVAGRSHPELQNVIGMFVNMLPMRNFPKRDLSFLNFLSQVKGRALKAYQNQDYQFDQLVEKIGIEREYGRNPLFDTQFTFQDLRGKPGQTHEKERAKGAGSEAFSVETRSMQFELSLNGRANNTEVLLAFQYMDALFKHSTILNMVQHYMEILEQVLSNGNISLEQINLSHNLQKGISILSRDEALDFDF